MHIATASRKTTLRLLELPVKFQLQSTLANPYSFALPLLAFMFGVSDIGFTFVICIAFAWVHVWCVLLDLFFDCCFHQVSRLPRRQLPSTVTWMYRGFATQTLDPKPHIAPATSHLPEGRNDPEKQTLNPYMVNEP